MKLQDMQGAESYVKQTTDPKSANFHKFLTVQQFRSRFGPSDVSIQQTVAYLTAAGYKNISIDKNGVIIHAQGSTALVNNTFNTQLHDYLDASGKKFHAPSAQPHMPMALVNANVTGVAGLNTAKHHKSHIAQMLTDEGPVSVNTFHAANSVTTVPGTATNKPGQYTVGDVALHYNITPLYNKGISGSNTTIGIMTLANFYPQDAYTYWSSIGLSVSPSRITQVHVDGGGELSSNAGSGETSLDVEQSGGLAPYANMIVYDGPNTNQGVIDVLSQAVSDNIADVLSYSRGMPEMFYYNTDANGNITSEDGNMPTLHSLYLEAAAQGQSVFVAAGDSGAYDTNRDLPFPAYSKTLGVDYPAADPAVTAAGGTTLPITVQKRHGIVTVPSERPWSWDYFSNYYVTYYGNASVWEDIFSVGGGGGVSTYWSIPSWQSGVAGTKTSVSGQILAPSNNQGYAPWIVLPSGFAGRNVPDISLNADPYSGYLELSTADGGWIAGYGGTSFVAPQLAGITALLTQYTGGRIGQLAPQLYPLQAQYGYRQGSPFNAITTGDNWYYQAATAYSPAVGLGTLNVFNLATALYKLYQ